MYYTYVQGVAHAPTITDVQTDVHIVPVDCDRPLLKLLILPTPRVALVQDKGIQHPQRAPLDLSIDVLTRCNRSIIVRFD